MLDPDSYPTPSCNPSLVMITLTIDDDPDDFAIDVDDETIAARTEFSWVVKFTVSGTWVADGFDLNHERALEMLRTDLGYAHEYEVGAQVLKAPPASYISAMQGGRDAEAKQGQEALDALRVAAVNELTIDLLRARRTLGA